MRFVLAKTTGNYNSGANTKYYVVDTDCYSNEWYQVNKEDKTLTKVNSPSVRISTDMTKEDSLFFISFFKDVYSTTTDSFSKQVCEVYFEFFGMKPSEYTKKYVDLEHGVTKKLETEWLNGIRVAEYVNFEQSTNPQFFIIPRESQRVRGYRSSFVFGYYKNENCIYTYDIISNTRHNYNTEKIIAVEPTEELLKSVFNSIDTTYLKNSVSQHSDASRALSYLVEKYTVLKNFFETETCSCCGTHGLFIREINGKKLCSRCYAEQVTTCSSCNETILRNEAERTREGNYLCPNCAKREKILPYHRNYPVVKFFGNNKDNKVPYLGVELEVDEGGENHSNAKKLMHKINPADTLFAYCSHDGSLNNGFEIITQPATLEYHYSIKDVYERSFQMLKSNGYLSHDTTTCGLHVHFNRNFYAENEELYISRLLFMVEKFWDELVIFARRPECRMERYSKKISPMEITEYIHRSNRSNSHDFHYYAVNLANDDTIEFRMFKGTLNASTLMATLQLVSNMILFAKEKPVEELQAMNFSELVTGTNMKRYWKRRCEISDTEE